MVVLDERKWIVVSTLLEVVLMVFLKLVGVFLERLVDVYSTEWAALSSLLLVVL